MKIIQIIPAPPGYFARLNSLDCGGVIEECRVVCLALVEDPNGNREVIGMRVDQGGAELCLINDFSSHKGSYHVEWELFFQ